MSGFRTSVRVSVLGAVIAAASGWAMLDSPSLAQAEPGPARTKFTIFIYESASEVARRGETGEKAQAYWGPYMAYAKELQQAGVMHPGGCCLETDAHARVIKRRRGEQSIGKGAHAAPADGHVLGGYFIIEAANMDEAIKWAEKAPNLETGAVEVRASYPTPM